MYMVIIRTLRISASIVVGPGFLQRHANIYIELRSNVNFLLKLMILTSKSDEQSTLLIFLVKVWLIKYG